ncbi:MAG: hypothetical protein KF715_14855 [Candidatus Didemnitutus sp.]|nr:hypothetical protein [Candidatus Didemnitutus sp.]
MIARSLHLLGACGAMLVSAAACAVESASALFPFVVPWDDAAPSVANVAAWNDAPAGARGQVFAADGHLWQPDPAAPQGLRRMRFIGVNFSFAANFPTHADAEKIAAHLAKLGLNCVRFHHMDRDAAPKGLWQPDLKTIDPVQLDRLDFFISRLKAHGVYADLNLHVSRIYPDFPTWTGMPLFHKGVDLFTPGMIALQKDFARTLLHHVNPYTGATYAQEPAVAFVEINNENGLVSRWWEKSLDEMPEFYVAELARQWAAWRRAHNLPTDGDAIIRRRDYAIQGEPRRRDWVRFLWETEAAYWREMQRYLKEDLGVRALVVGTQLYSYSTLPLQAEMDVVDIHAYWQHPEYPDKTNRALWTVGNESMVNHAEARTISDLALQRVAGKPLIVTEYNHSSPNTYGAEAFPIVAAYAALQDWDAFFVYSYSHGNQPWDEAKINGNFDIWAHSAKLATLPVAAALFRRGDVATPASGHETNASAEQFFELTTRYGVNIGGQHFGASRFDALRRPQSLRLGAPAPVLTTPPRFPYAGPIASDTGELRWDARAPRGVFTVDTPRTKAAIGFTDGRRLELGPVMIAPGTTRQGWSAIALTQMDGNAIGTAGRALLVACGDLENTGQIWKSSARDSVTAWGSAPVVVEGIPAEISVMTSLEVAVWALDERGQRRAEVPVRREASRITFSIGPECRTLWYEVVFGATR